MKIILGPPRKKSPAESLQLLCTQENADSNSSALKSWANKIPKPNPMTTIRYGIPGFSPPRPPRTPARDFRLAATVRFMDPQSFLFFCLFLAQMTAEPRSGSHAPTPLPTPSTREPPPPPVGGGRAGLAEHLQAQGDGPPLPLPHAPTPIPLSPPRPALGSHRRRWDGPPPPWESSIAGPPVAATMGVGHRGAGNEVGTMNRCSVICKAGRASLPLRRRLRLFYPRHRKRPGMPTLSRVPVRLTPRGRAYDLRAFVGLGLHGHHLPGDHCVQVSLGCWSTVR